ncbi:CD276 antigen-like [Sardina pilchardus]|uniref:CD276 antigen-like n=1 Tax=Sardina pilchardus TaxID=27697 RepID=UPI002E1148DC
MAHFVSTSLAAFVVIVLVHCCRECHAVEFRSAGPDRPLEVVDIEDEVDSSEDFRLVGPRQPLEVLVGEDVVLPCSLDPRINAADFTVQWTTFAYDEPTNKVHVHRNGREHNREQIDSFRGRTALFLDQLQEGNVSLRLSQTRMMDTRTYICIVLQSSTRQRYAVVPLTVRAKGSVPEISVEACEADGCKLVCRSHGWSPKPAVDWLDGKKIKLTTDAATSEWDPVGGVSVRRTLIAQPGDTYTCRVAYKDHIQHADVHICNFTLVGPGSPLLGEAGQDVVLPCSLSAHVAVGDAEQLSVVWYRLQDSTQTHIHVHSDGEDQTEDQDPAYHGRTSLFRDQIAGGNLSLKLSSVRLSDAGRYQCTADAGDGNHDNTDMEVQVRAVGTPPVIFTDRRGKTQLSLRCVSSGWSPKPDVDWLDAEGRSLPAETTETWLEPEGFRVERRLLVDKKWNDSSSYHCRLSQMGLVRETHKNVTDDDEEEKGTVFSPKMIIAAVCIPVTIAVVTIFRARGPGGLRERGAQALMRAFRGRSRSHLWILLCSGVVACASTGNFTLVGPGSPLLAEVGQDVVLPCSLSAHVAVGNAEKLSVVWYRLQDSTQTHILVHSDGEDQDQAYRGRTALFRDQIAGGNLSLKLSSVRLSDAGRYQCTADAGDGNHDNADMEVQVRAVGTTPVIFTDRRGKTQLSLRCVSSGWSPKPDVDWLDAEGRSLPAEPMETWLEPEGFRVERRLLVDKKWNDSSSYHCRLSQMGLVRETHKNVTAPDGDKEKKPAGLQWGVAMAVVCSSVTVVAVVVARSRGSGGLREKAACALMKLCRGRCICRNESPKTAPTIASTPSSLDNHTHTQKHIG